MVVGEGIGKKIYSKFLLDKLKETIEPKPFYQARFKRNRSTDDHIFVVKRVLDER